MSREVRNRLVHDPEENLDTPEFRELLKRTFDEARQKTWDAGLPVTAAKDGYIIKRYPDGKIQRVKKIEKQQEPSSENDSELENAILGLGLGLLLGVVIASLFKNKD
jgi:hypothetical protein